MSQMFSLSACPLSGVGVRKSSGFWPARADPTPRDGTPLESAPKGLLVRVHQVDSWADSGAGVGRPAAVSVIEAQNPLGADRALGVQGGATWDQRSAACSG